MHFNYKHKSIIHRDMLKNFRGEWLSDCEQQHYQENRDSIDEFYHRVPVDYKYNSLGYRTKELDEFKDDFILAMGCSHTEGTALPEEYIWCNVLGKLIDHDVCNLGAAGQGLQFILYNTELYIRNHPTLPKMVVIQHPERSRLVSAQYDRTDQDDKSSVNICLRVQSDIHRDTEYQQLEQNNITHVFNSAMLTNIITRMWNSVSVPVLHWTFNTDGESWLSEYEVMEIPHDVDQNIYRYDFDLARDLAHHGYRNHRCVAEILADRAKQMFVASSFNVPADPHRETRYEHDTFEYTVSEAVKEFLLEEIRMSEEINDQTHEGSMGTDRHPPSGTELDNREAELKRRIEELRKRDPFIYR